MAVEGTEPDNAAPRVLSMELSTAEPVTPAAGYVGGAAMEPFEAFYRANLDRVYRALAVTLSNSDLAREATDCGRDATSLGVPSPRPGWRRSPLVMLEYSP